MYHLYTNLNGLKTYAFKSRSHLIKNLTDIKKILIAVNAEKIINANSFLKKILFSNIGYPDGVGAILALKAKGFSSTKIPGVELWLDIVNNFSSTHSFFLIGSTEAVLNKTVKKLHIDYPDIDIVGFRNGFFNESDFDALCVEVKNTSPDIVFVALGSPKQELIMNKLFNNHPALYMGLGGSFDIYSGAKKRAPKIIIKLYLEWLYRLIKEPKRIYRQIKLLKLFYLILFKKI